MSNSTQEFVSALEGAGELVRVRVPVSPVLEIARIADVVSKRPAPGLPSDAACRTDPAGHGLGGPALLFERVEGCEFPVLINALGSYRRMEMALGCHDGGPRPGGFEAIGARIGELVKPQPPRSFGEAIAKARQFAPLLRIGPKLGRRGACQEVVMSGDDVDLTRIPMIRCWPHDGDYAALGYPSGVNDGVLGLGHPELSAAAWEATCRGRYVTFAGVHTIHADDAGEPRPASHNIGMYRVQLLGKRTLAMHWHVHHDGAAHWRSWKRRGERMPVAIAFGGQSVLPYAATCPLPPGISELLMAGFLHGRGIPMVRAKTVPLRVPADAEMVIEGYVSDGAGPIGWDPRDPGSGPLGEGAVFEGPFGDHTGFYSMPDRYPLLEVTAVTHRRGAVFPATVVGLPPQEDYYLGKATERIMLPLLKTIIPDIEDYDLPIFGAFHNCAFVRIRKQYPLHARRVMHAIWGAGQMSWTKAVFVVDENVDVHDARAVLEAAARWCRPDADVERVRGPLDILDHAAPGLGMGTKIGFDCTRKSADERAYLGGREGGAGGAEPDVGGAAWSDGVRQVREVLGVLDARVSPEAPGWLLVRVDRGYGEPDRAGTGASVLAAIEGIAGSAALPPFVVIVGRDVDLADAAGVLFQWLANADAGRDAVVAHGPGGASLVFDATPKTSEDAGPGGAVRAWPPVLEMDRATCELVERRWPEYGIRLG